MRVRVDPAGDDVGALGVDGLVTLEVGADGGDGLALDQNVRLEAALSGDDSAALDDLAHHLLSISVWVLIERLQQRRIDDRVRIVRTVVGCRTFEIPEAANDCAVIGQDQVGRRDERAGEKAV